MTVHQIVIYYKENEELISKSFCIISDSVKHEAVAVHSFIRGILPKIKTGVSNLKKIFFFSDSGPAHYKNRFNFANLSLFESDHGVPAVWHFWATCHGKNACDGVGGTVKRLARRASLQLSLILNPLDLYNWAMDNITGIEFIYVTKDIIAADAERLC